jgi:antitoxin VapB
VAIFPDRHVKLFRTGGHQAVHIPQEFELPRENAIMRKEGDRLVIELAPAGSLLGFLATMTPLDEDFLPLSDLVSDPVVF